MSPILADNAFFRATITNVFFFFSMNGFILLLYIHGLGGTEVEIGVVMGLYNAVGILCGPRDNNVILSASVMEAR